MSTKLQTIGYNSLVHCAWLKFVILIFRLVFKSTPVFKMADLDLDVLNQNEPSDDRLVRDSLYGQISMSLMVRYNYSDVMKLYFAPFQCDSALNELFKFKLRDIDYQNELYKFPFLMMVSLCFVVICPYDILVT